MAAREYSVNVAPAAADDTVVLFRARRDGRLNGADYVQSANATAVTSYTVKIRNQTAARDLTATIDIKALGALAGESFVLGADPSYVAGDVIVAVFEETGGTVTSPGEAGFTMELDEYVGSLGGPAWAG
jgi:hypothetical protein